MVLSTAGCNESVVSARATLLFRKRDQVGTPGVAHADPGRLPRGSADSRCDQVCPRSLGTTFLLCSSGSLVNCSVTLATAPIDCSFSFAATSVASSHTLTATPDASFHTLTAASVAPALTHAAAPIACALIVASAAGIACPFRASHSGVANRFFRCRVGAPCHAPSRSGPAISARRLERTRSRRPSRSCGGSFGHNRFDTITPGAPHRFGRGVPGPGGWWQWVPGVTALADPAAGRNRLRRDGGALGWSHSFSRRHRWIGETSPTTSGVALK